jgi:hypothetical protein
MATNRDDSRQQTGFIVRRGKPGDKVKPTLPCSSCRKRSRRTVAHKAAYVMEWTQPHFETASIERAKMVTSTIKRSERVQP